MLETVDWHFSKIIIHSLLLSKDAFPFAVIGSEDLVGDKKVYGRQYLWGVAEGYLVLWGTEVVADYHLFQFFSTSRERCPLRLQEASQPLA